MGHARVVGVVPDVAAIGKTFHYEVPDALEEDVRVGTSVRIRLHGRRVRGWVVELVDGPGELEPERELRPIEAVVGWGPPSSVIEVSRWASWRWAGPLSAFLKAASAPKVVRSIGPGGRCSRQAAKEPVGFSRVPEAEHETVEPFPRATTVLREPPASDPLSIVERACGVLDARIGDAGVLVLAPTHRGARAFASRLRSKGRAVALMPDDWAKARAGTCVVVGTRNAALAPLPRLAAAVVLDAHDEAYHEERSPTWCAWEVVAERCARDRAPCVLVSPCPTLDVLEAGQLVAPQRGHERSGWPPIEVVDRRKDDPRTGLFSERVVSVVRWAAEKEGRTALCVLNRTGRARLLACASCGEIARCETCGGRAQTVQAEGADWLVCARCGVRRPVVCARCGHRVLKSLRIGVSRAREELEALAGTSVTETWGPESPHERARERPFLTGRVAVGTEALLHRVDVADVVVFLDFDSELLATRMRAAEEAMALLSLASRVVAGSRNMPAPATRAPGRVVVQSRIPAHPVLVAAVSADPPVLVDHEAATRRALALPPYGALATISGPVAADYVRSLSELAEPRLELTGPLDGRWTARAPDRDTLSDALSSVTRPRGRLRVEVDPVRI